MKQQVKPAWLEFGIHVGRKPYGIVQYTVVVLDDDGERAKLKEITDGMPGAIWVSWNTLNEKWFMTWRPRG